MFSLWRVGGERRRAADYAGRMGRQPEDIFRFAGAETGRALEAVDFLTEVLA